MTTVESLRSSSMLLLVMAMAGCASAPPMDPGAPSAPSQVASPEPAPAPAPDRVETNPSARSAATPVASPGSIDTLETILNRISDDSGIQISRTPTGALLIRATGDTAFSTGSSSLSPRFNQFLQQLSNGLLTYDRLTAKVSGHTDSSGDATLNNRLSEARAQATISRLVALGVPAGRLLAEGKGESEPLASNDTAEGRATNRRVDVLIIDPAL